MALKDRISSPLEAGPSILDGHNLPTQLSDALEYASKRLARKALHLTLVVVRRDYQIPSSALSSPASADTSGSPPSATSSVPASAASTPARPAFNLASIKNFVWSSTSPLSQGSGTAAQERHVPTPLDLQRNGMVSPAFSISSMSSASTASMSSAADSTFSSGPRLRWPLSPTTPSSLSMPRTPATPFTTASYTTPTTTDAGSAMSGVAGPQGPNPFGIRLVHVSPLSVREERALKHSLEKAGRRFRIGTDWLPNAVSPSAYGLNADLMHRSLAQNEVLFSSEGLTLLSLDHLYTFKAALASYARTQSPRRLEDAVDELRRRVLSQGRRKLRKSDLLAAYTWLGQVSDAALSDVTRMYRRAYGGAAGEGGVENDVNDRGPPPSWPLPDGPDEKPLPALPADPEADPGLGGPGASSSAAWRSDKDLEKRFCVDFDFDLEIEEYYRERAREVEAEKAEVEEVEKKACAVATAAAAAALEEMRRTTPKLSPPPPPRMPVLKLQTTFDKKPGLLRPVPQRRATEDAGGAGGGAVELGVDGGVETQRQGDVVEKVEEEDEEEELTARPKSGHPNTLAIGLQKWNSMTIDEMINDVESRMSRMGPMTPHAYDDISPITRGEWGFLMVGDGWKKTAAVEMC